jgi:hypothetical protein
MPETYSFDFGHRFVTIRHWPTAFLVFSEDNVYTPDPGSMRIEQSAGGMTIRADAFAWAGLQQKAPGRFEAHVRYVEGGFECSIEAVLHERIKGTALLLRDARPKRVPTRDYGDVEFQPSGHLLPYPAYTRLPVWPLLQNDGAFTTISSLDEQVRRKVLAVVPEGNAADGRVLLELHHHEDARHWSMKQTTPTWRVVRGLDPGSQLKERCELAERVWGLRPWETRSDVPDWARRIGLVLNLHGAHWTGHVFNTYAQQLDAIRYVADRLGGERVLAFLAAWDGRYNYNWPGYQPDESMGGAAGLRALIDGAHALGVRLIPQLGAVSANRRYLPPALHDCGIHDAYGNEYIKEVDWDNDRAPDSYRVNANIGHPGFRTFMLDHIVRLRETLGFDGVFLDINMTFHNDPRFSIVEGHRALAQACHERFKDFLIFGENWYDALMPMYPLVHSVVGRESGWMMRWPEVFNRYCRTTHHLTHPAPGHGSTGVYEAGFSAPFDPDPSRDVIPALSFVHDTLREHRPAVDRTVEIARQYIRRCGI